MAVETPRLRISSPAEPIVPGRGFYQLEEDVLYVQIGLFADTRRFFSYLESDYIRLDCDRAGRLIFIEVRVPRRNWPIDENLGSPEVAEMADVRWLDFRSPMDAPVLSTPPDRNGLLIRFSPQTATRNYYLADTVVVQVDDANGLVALWIGDIRDDLAGREIGAYRKSCRKKLS